MRKSRGWKALSRRCFLSSLERKRSWIFCSFLERRSRCSASQKKSVAYAIAKTLEEAGARVLYIVRSQARREQLQGLLQGRKVFVCDVERQEEIDRVALEIQAECPKIHGLVHSIAFADYSEGIKPFHETSRKQFLQSVDISCFSLVALCNALRDALESNASVVTIGISTTRMASESYGFMAPVKAALESSLAFLTKSFSRFSQVRFNSVSAGLLKTSASLGFQVTSMLTSLLKQRSLEKVE